MDMKTQIISILDKEHYTFGQLATYLQMTEDGLTLELTNKTLELRNLEAIAKALKVPLYSFFRAEGPSFDLGRHPYHMNKLWTGNDELKDAKQLEAEILLLQQIIALKEQQILRRSA
jgi:hypothetical protein